MNSLYARLLEPSWGPNRPATIEDLLVALRQLRVTRGAMMTKSMLTSYGVNRLGDLDPRYYGWMVDEARDLFIT